MDKASLDPVTTVSSYTSEYDIPRMLRYLEHKYNSGDKIAPWNAIWLCGDCNIQFPQWVNKYLLEGAFRLRMLVHETSPSGSCNTDREAEAVGRALGFGGNKGRGNVFSEWAKSVRDMCIFGEFVMSIKKGVKPGTKMYEEIGARYNVGSDTIRAVIAGYKKMITAEVPGKWPDILIE